MSPNYYLLMLIGALAIGLATSAAVSVLRGRALHAQATRLGLQFSHPDRFLLAARVARQLPIPGASEVSIRDVAYSKTPEGLACIMTVRFTIGTMGRRRNQRRVVAALDPGGDELLHFKMLPTPPNPQTYADAAAHLTAQT
jgi:hypothetical protein